MYFKKVLRFFSMLQFWFFYEYTFICKDSKIATYFCKCNLPKIPILKINFFELWSALSSEILLTKRDQIVLHTVSRFHLQHKNYTALLFMRVVTIHRIIATIGPFTQPFVFFLVWNSKIAWSLINFGHCETGSFTEGIWLYKLLDRI